MNTIHPSLVDAAAAQTASQLEPSQVASLVGYWAHGHSILAKQLAEADAQAKGDDWYSHAPMGLSPEGARGWHSARVDSLRHALEMMGIPEGYGLEIPA